MIKKFLIAEELAAGMQSELRKIASGETPDVVKAGECLHAALEILEDAGLHKQAGKVLDVLEKIATDPKTRVRQMPTLAELMKHGLTHKDVQQFGEGHHGAKAKMNRALRNMGMDDKQIAEFVGAHNLIPEEDLKRFEMFNRWMQNPTESDTGPVQPGQTVSMESLPGPATPAKAEEPEDPTLPKELTFESIAGRKPGRPDKIHDPHTNKLSPEKMVANLKHHGTEFNMPDLGWASFDPEGAAALDAEIADDLNIDDILDAEIGGDSLEVSEELDSDDFEDEVSLPK